MKVGSNVLTRPDGHLDVTRMSALVDQIAQLRRRGIEVVLVSSGAVASGRSMLSPEGMLDDVDSRQLFSAIGQARLINRYYELFRDHGIIVGQVLTMKEAFAEKKHYDNQRNCMQVMLRAGVLPVVNENDTVSLEELMFTDNDELSGVIATMLDCDRLIILSDIDGVYDAPPTEPGARLLPLIRPEDDLTSCVVAGKSRAGRGGMLSKTRVARSVAAQGIAVTIACGRRENVLLDLMDGKDIPCTTFVPVKRG